MNEDAARAYRESTTLLLTGELNRECLLQALQTVVDRHGALRTTIAPDGQSQTIHARQLFELDYIDYSDLPPAEAQAEAENMLLDLESGTFDKMKGPFLAASLLKIEETRHFLTFFFHHVIANGPSYWVFLDELAALYEAYTSGRPALLPPAFPFAEFVESKRLYEQSREKEEAEIFWLKQMAGGVPVLDLPFDYPLPPELTYRGSREEIVMEPELTEALRKVGAAHRCSLFMVLLSAYGVLLHRLSGQDDLVIGVPFDSPIRSENAERKSVRQHHEHAALAQHSLRRKQLCRLSLRDEGADHRRLRASGLFLWKSHRQTQPAARSVARALLQRHFQSGDRASFTGSSPASKWRWKPGTFPTAHRATPRCSISI